MAKKSAKSKGYRKTVKQKPFLTKKEIIALVVIVAVILLAVILFNLFYDDGYLGADEVQPGTIVSYASSDLRDRYAKIGEIGEIEGFTLDERAEDALPIEPYTFTPDGEADHVTSISVSGSFVGAADLANSTLSYMSAFMESESNTSSASSYTEVFESEIQGHKAYIFGYTYDSYVAPEGEAVETEVVEAEAAETEAAEAEQPAPNTFSQSLSAYVDLGDNHTMCMHIYRSGEDASYYLTDDQIVDFVQNYSTAFVLDAAEAAA